MDASEMQELLQGYLSEMNWGGGASKDDILAHLAGRDETLRMMINEYVAEGTYPDPEALLSVLPAQAWQDAQGDKWRGSGGLLAADTESGYQESPAGQDQPGAYRAGGQTPPTPGFGTTEPEGTATGSGGGMETRSTPMAGAQASGAPLGAGQAAGAAAGSGGENYGMTDADGADMSDAMAADAGTEVDVVVVGVDVDGDGAPDIVVADAIVYDETLGGGSGEGAGGSRSTSG